MNWVNEIANLTYARSFQGYRINSENQLVDVSTGDPVQRSGKLEGDVTVETNASSLLALQNVTRITGELYIEDNTKLTSLKGLDAIEYIGAVSIWRNSALKTLDGLGQLRRVGPFQFFGDFEVSSNPKLISIGSLSKLEYIGDDADIKFNDKLRVIELKMLQFVGDNFDVYSNKLATRVAFPNLKAVGHEMEVNRMPNLRALDLRHLLQVGSSGLLGVDGIVSTESVYGGELGIYNLPKLRSLFTLRNLVKHPYFFNLDIGSGMNKLAGLGNLFRNIKVMNGDVEIDKIKGMTNLAMFADLIGIKDLEIDNNRLKKIELPNLQRAESLELGDNKGPFPTVVFSAPVLKQIDIIDINLSSKTKKLKVKLGNLRAIGQVPDTFGSYDFLSLMVKKNMFSQFECVPLNGCWLYHGYMNCSTEKDKTDAIDAYPFDLDNCLE